jgi:negative regulator of sigma E activity
MDHDLWKLMCGNAGVAAAVILAVVAALAFGLGAWLF